MMFDWLVVGQVLPVNPASAVRGPRYSVKKGKTPMPSPEGARTLVDYSPSPVGLRDRALIALSLPLEEPSKMATLPRKCPSLPQGGRPGAAEVQARLDHAGEQGPVLSR
jgi:hypothetical protein